MCTAVSFKTRHHYFGRNLDLEYHYNEQITLTPRHFPFSFRMEKQMDTHFAMIGMATIADGYPLYYEATNEKGLSIAGLNFPGNACYFPPKEGKTNIAPYELIPYLLGKCQTVKEAKALLQSMNLCSIPFSDQYPLSPLHWMIADQSSAIVVESMQDGLHIHPNPVGVLTNNPPFPYHLQNLCNYRSLSPAPHENTFAPDVELPLYSLGMGAMGMPGDWSSPSRFVRAAFVRAHSLCDGSEAESVSQFFHILGSVSQPRGCTYVRPEEYELTLYSSCCNTDTGVYYLKTYDNARICTVDMQKENLDSEKLITWSPPLLQDVLTLN